MEISQNIYSDSNKLALVRRQSRSEVNFNMSPSEIGDFMSKLLIEEIKKNFDRVVSTKGLSKELPNK